MPEDKDKRNKRIAAWQQDRRIVVILSGGKLRGQIESAATAQGQSVNAWINDAIDAKLKRD